MKNELNVAMGKRIREQRTLLGYTREKFAEALGISERFATDIELGNRGMSFANLIRLCKLLSISSDYILMGKTDEVTEEQTKLVKIASGIDEKYAPYAEELLCTFTKTINAAEND